MHHPCHSDVQKWSNFARSNAGFIVPLLATITGRRSQAALQFWAILQCVK